jgi:hypothetical protein
MTFQRELALLASLDETPSKKVGAGSNPEPPAAI